jgi:hypothetical protein
VTHGTRRRVVVRPYPPLLTMGRTSVARQRVGRGVASADADVVWVGLGAPEQDHTANGRHCRACGTTGLNGLSVRTAGRGDWDGGQADGPPMASQRCGSAAAPSNSKGQQK